LVVPTSYFRSLTPPTSETGKPAPSQS